MTIIDTVSKNSVNGSARFPSLLAEIPNREQAMISPRSVDNIVKTNSNEKDL